MSNPSGPASGGVPTCYRHPDRETWIRCQRCQKPICPDCMRDAAVGFHCPDCVKFGARETRQSQATYGGQRSADPRITSFVLIGINAVVWLAITATGGRSSRLGDMLALTPAGRCLSLQSPGMFYPDASSQALCASGTGTDGDWMPGVADGSVWQLLTSAFTHVEIWHIATNMLALFFFGPVLEQILGRWRFLAVYLAGALGGSVFVLWFSAEHGSTVGASGALFGLLGALLVTFTKARLNSTWLLQNLVLGVVITVVGWNYISWQGHLGGFVGGAAAAAIVVYAPKSHRAAVQWAGLGALYVVLLALAFVRAAALA